MTAFSTSHRSHFKRKHHACQRRKYRPHYSHINRSGFNWRDPFWGYRDLGLGRRNPPCYRYFSFLPCLCAVRITHMSGEKMISVLPCYRELTQSVSKSLDKLRTDRPDLMRGFNDLAKAASLDGALDQKTKELIALALDVAAHMRCMYRFPCTHAGEAWNDENRA